MYEPPSPPQTTTSELRAWVRTFLPLLAAGLLLYGGWALLQASSSPPSTTATASMPSAPISLPASPVAVNVVFPDTLTIVTQVPPPKTPVPTTPKVTPFVNLCGNWLQTGEVCQMSEAPPTPTPSLPDCPTLENKECVWTGKPGADVPIVATSVPSYGSG